MVECQNRGGVECEHEWGAIRRGAATQKMKIVEAVEGREQVAEGNQVRSNASTCDVAIFGTDTAAC